MKKTAVLLLFLAAQAAVFAQSKDDARRSVADFETEVQSNLDSYMEKYREYTSDPGANSIKNSLAAYQWRFKILEGWIDDERKNLDDLVSKGLTFTTYTTNRFYALINEYKKLTEEFAEWNSRVNPPAD